MVQCSNDKISCMTLQEDFESKSRIAPHYRLKQGYRIIAVRPCKNYAYVVKPVKFSKRDGTEWHTGQSMRGFLQKHRRFKTRKL